ncbi:MAG: hypothetical protein QXX95_04585 [Nitrososphaerales archaeon]
MSVKTDDTLNLISKYSQICRDVKDLFNETRKEVEKQTPAIVGIYKSYTWF